MVTPEAIRLRKSRVYITFLLGCLLGFALLTTIDTFKRTNPIIIREPVYQSREKVGIPYKTSGIFPKPTVPITLVIPCNIDDWPYTRLLLNSIANQTKLPAETIVIAQAEPSSKNGTLSAEYLFLNHDPEEYAQYLKDGGLPHPPYPKWEGHLKPFLQKLDKRFPPELIAMENIPNLKIHMRAGQFYAGNNRAYGASLAKNEIVSFFDCDDVMHPNRMEVLNDIFEKNSKLEAVIHAYFWLPFATFEKSLSDFYAAGQPVPEDPPWIVSDEEMWKRLPVKKYAKYPKGEPTQQRSYDEMWWFPVGMHLPNPNKRLIAGHNGWLTIKKSTMKEVPYPDIPRGQDSLYNYRLIRAKRHWNYYPSQLGGYVRRK